MSADDPSQWERPPTADDLWIGANLFDDLFTTLEAEFGPDTVASVKAAMAKFIDERSSHKRPPPPPVHPPPCPMVHWEA